jgi:hypothetical protein
MPVSTVAATGATGQPFERMARLLSACPTFQTAMGVGTSDDAFDLIDYPYWRQDNSDTPSADFDTQPVPGCTIARVDDLGMRWEIYKNQMFRGDLMVEIRVGIDPDFAGNSKDRLIDFMNTVDAIYFEAFTRANVTAGDQIHAIELNEPITELVSPQETQPDVESTPDGKPFLIAAHIVEVVA